MLSPSDYNCAVPQFTNGNYAANPINPLYIEEPSSTDYNRGTEPLQTLPAQWWNWLMNQFTARFNKLNLYVKNIFNELTQLLSIGNITPDGTEATPTVTQIKDFFQTCYPDYIKTSSAISDTYVPKTTMVNGHALSDNVTVTRSDLGLGTSATVNTGTAAGCIPTVGTALGTTDGQFLATDSTGKLKPSGYTASCFRASTWTPTCVACMTYTGAGNGVVTAYQTSSAYCGSTADWASYLIFNHGDGSSYYNQMIRMPFGGVPQYQRKSAGTNSGWKTFITSENIANQSVCYATSTGSATCATCAKYLDSVTSQLHYGVCLGGLDSSQNVCLKGYCSTTAKGIHVSIADCASKDGSGCAFGTAARCAATAFRACTWTPTCVACAGANGSGTAFGTAATCAATAFRASTWYPDSTSCGCVKYAACSDTKTRLAPSSLNYTPANYSSSLLCVKYDSASNYGTLCLKNCTAVPLQIYYQNKNTCGTSIAVPGCQVNLVSGWCCSGTRVLLISYLM